MSLRSYLENTERLAGVRLVGIRREINQLRGGNHLNSVMQAYLKWFRNNYEAFSKHFMSVSFRLPNGTMVHTDITNFVTVKTPVAVRVAACVRLPLSLYPNGYTNMLGERAYWVPLYRSSGNNSRRKGSWFPLLGIMRCPRASDIIYKTFSVAEHFLRMEDDLLSNLPSEKEKNDLTKFLREVDADKRKFNSHTWLIKCGGLSTFLDCHLNVTEEERRRLFRASKVTSKSLFPHERRKAYTCGEDFFERLNKYMGENTSLEYVPTEGDDETGPIETGPMYVFRHKNTEIQHRSFMTAVFRDDIFAMCMERINVFGVHLRNDFPDKNMNLISKALIHMGGGHEETAAELEEAMYLRSPDQIARDVLDRMVDRQPKPDTSHGDMLDEGQSSH